jgi:non-homologous end joining protein Ku
MKLIEKKVEAGGKELPAGKKPHAAAATNIIDLVAVLQKSLSEAGGGKASAASERSRLKTRAPATPKRVASKITAKKRGTHKHAA